MSTRDAFRRTLQFAFLVMLLAALALPHSSAEQESNDPVDVLRKAVLQRDYGRWWDVLTEDARQGKSRDEYIRDRKQAASYALEIFERRHGVPFVMRVREFCAWSAIDRQYYQGRYRIEFRSKIHLAGKSWVYATTCYFKLRVVGEKVSLSYTDVSTEMKVVPGQVTL